MARSVSQAGGVGQGTVIRVAIVADIRLYREGLARVLERQPNISVVATAATGDGSLAPLLQLGPDVILIDKAMPDSLQAMRRGGMAAPGGQIVSLRVSEGGADGGGNWKDPGRKWRGEARVAPRGGGGCGCASRSGPARSRVGHRVLTRHASAKARRTDAQR